MCVCVCWGSERERERERERFDREANVSTEDGDSSVFPSRRRKMAATMCNKCACACVGQGGQLAF